MKRAHPPGQSLVEFVAGIGVAFATFAGAACLWKAQWEKSRCAYLAFEATHAARAGRPGPAIPRGVRVRVDSDRTDFHGRAECGAARETVTLPRLEAL